MQIDIIYFVIKIYNNQFKKKYFLMTKTNPCI